MLYIDVLFVVLTVPLVDKTHMFNLHKSYNLPVLHPHLQKQLQHTIPNQYVAISKNWINIIYPMAD